MSQEPVIHSHSDMGGRYFTFQLAAMTRTTSSMWAGAPPGRTLVTSLWSDFALVGRGWTGELPDGVSQVTRSPTPVDPGRG
jgi:hypothetical protein